MSEQPHDTEPVTIVLATRNQGKVRELAEPLRAFGLRVVGLDAFPDLPEVEETGTTFEENALLKAREVSKRTGLVAIAGDSGLEVDALNGAPGVLRPLQPGHADLPNATKDERNTMKPSRPSSGRSGTVRRLHRRRRLWPEGEPSSPPGIWEGRSPLLPARQKRLRYDPVFLDPELGLTAAKCPRKKK
ncbi:MAG: non-canonical purine NTP pyrophosphatase [Bilophila wadsworthia]